MFTWRYLEVWLVIVSGDAVVTARCDLCWRYLNPREMAEFSPGARRDAYSRGRAVRAWRKVYRVCYQPSEETTRRVHISW